MSQAWFAALLIAAAGGRGSDLAEQIPPLLKQHKVEGASVALIDHGRVASTLGFGLASVKQQIPVTPRTLFNVGSISKPLTAVAVLQLTGQRTLDLDAPVERYLGGWRLPPSSFDPQGVTLRRILSHTAGLSIAGVWTFHPNQPLLPLRETLARDTPNAEEVDELWDGKGGVRIILQPGRKWRYSGGGRERLN